MALFEAGASAKERGDYSTAIAYFKEALAVDLSFGDAERELAHTLLLDGQFSASETLFKRLLLEDPNRANHPGYKRFLSIIAANKPFGWSGSFALVPSTNVNRGSGEETLGGLIGVIPEESRADSGIGVQAGLSAYYKFRPDAATRITLNTSVQGTKYDNTSYDRLSVTLRPVLERVTSIGKFTVSPFVSRTFRTDDQDLTRFGISAGFERPLGNRTTLGLTASHESRNYLKSEPSDGTFFDATAILSYRIASNVKAQGGVRFERSLTEEAYLAYNGYGMIAGLDNRWHSGVTTSVSAIAGVRNFDADFPLILVTDPFPREDKYYRLSISGRYDKFRPFGFEPIASCSYLRNLSNIALYDYRVTECGLSFSRSF